MREGAFEGARRLATSLGLDEASDSSDARTPYEHSEAHLFDHLMRLGVCLKRYILVYWYRMMDRGGALSDTLVVDVEKMMLQLGE